MSIAIPIIIYIICLGALITFQAFAVKRDGKLFFILSFVIGIVSSLISLLFTTYYGTVIDRLKTESAMMSVEAANMIPTYRTGAIVCLTFAFIFFASIIFTGILIVIKRIYEAKQ